MQKFLQDIINHAETVQTIIFVFKSYIFRLEKA